MHSSSPRGDMEYYTKLKVYQPFKRTSCTLVNVRSLFQNFVRECVKRKKLTKQDLKLWKLTDMAINTIKMEAKCKVIVVYQHGECNKTSSVVNPREEQELWNIRILSRFYLQIVLCISVGHAVLRVTKATAFLIETFFNVLLTLKFCKVGVHWNNTS